jgi:hypothetical protein
MDEERRVQGHGEKGQRDEVRTTREKRERRTTVVTRRVRVIQA